MKTKSGWDGSWGSKLQAASRFSWVMSNILLVAACGSGHGGDSGESQVLGDTDSASNQSGEVFDTEDLKKKIMEESRYPLSNIAHALGYGWVGGCGDGPVGDGYFINLPSKGDTSWEPSNSPGEKCDGFMARERTKIVYKDWRFVQSDIKYGEVKEISRNLVALDEIVYEASPVAYTANVKKSYSLTNTLSKRDVNTVRTSVEIGIEFGSMPAGVGWKASVKSSTGYEHTWDKTTIDSNTETAEGSATIPIPANTKVVVHVFREEVTNEVYYDASIDVTSSVAFEGFLRWGDCGGNWNINHRGSKKRPKFDYTFGNENKPFWDEIARQRDSNLAPFNWQGMAQNNDCFDHGAAVDNAIVGMQTKFKDFFATSPKIRGALQAVKGTKIVIKPEFFPVSP